MTARESQQGFTLLEIIIVTFILAIIASTVIMNVTPSRGEDNARTAAVIFKEKVEHARQIALSRNWVIGVDIEDSGYAFYRWHNRLWQPLHEPPLQAIEMDDLEFELILGDFAILDNISSGDRNAVFRSERGSDNEEAAQPRLLIFESTDFVPFTLLIQERFSGVRHWVEGRDGMHLQITDVEP